MRKQRARQETRQAAGGYAPVVVVIFVAVLVATLVLSLRRERPPVVSVAPEESAALALQKGCDVNCGNTYLYVMKALEQGLVTEDMIRRSLPAFEKLAAEYGLGGK